MRRYAGPRQNADWRSNFPNPIFDLDDDNGDFKTEEAEVTADSTSFPTAGAGYYFDVRLSHWYAIVGSVTTWRWDSGGGSILHSSQISSKPCIFCEWDTYRFDEGSGTTSYPSKAAPSSALVAEDSSTEAEIPPAFEIAADSHFKAAVHGRGEVELRPDLSRGLGRYVRNADAAAKKTISRGSAAGIVTFARPSSESDLSELASLGLEFGGVEAVGSGPGGVWTVGSEHGPDLDDRLAENAKERDISLDGIVAAEVWFPDAGAYTAGKRDDRVVVIDLALEQFGRKHPGIADVSMNDVYWHHAGLE